MKEAEMLRDEAIHNSRFDWLKLERESLRSNGKSDPEIHRLMIARIVEACENTVLNILHRSFFEQGWEVRAKIYDGLIAEPGKAAATRDLESAMCAAEGRCASEGWAVKLIEKPLHNQQDIDLPQIIEARAALHGWKIDSGLLCMCTNDTYSEVVQRRLFGMMGNRMVELQRVSDGTALFLFNLSKREITGVFARASDAGLNLEPDAWNRCARSPGVRRRCRCLEAQCRHRGSTYPVQIRFRDAPAPFRACLPIHEDVWNHILTVAPSGHTRSGKPHYELWLSSIQARDLARICMEHGAGSCG
jgi:hypothetical protein